MESYRYQFKSEADYKKFVAWLIDHFCDFTTQHNFNPGSADDIYTVTVSADDDNSDIFGAIGNFIDEETDLFKVHHTDYLYNSASDALNDPYADAQSLRRMLGCALEHNGQLDKQLDEKTACVVDLEERYAAAEKRYQQCFKQYVDLKDELSRIREQGKALALIANSIFPKD